MDDTALASRVIPAALSAAVLDHVSDAIVILDPAGRTLYANHAATLAGRDTVSPELRRLGEQARERRAPAEAMLGDWWCRAMPSEDGGLTLIARRDSAAATRQAEARLNQLFEHAPTDMLILQVQSDGRVVVEKGNTAFCRSSGLDATAIAGQPIEAVFETATAADLTADVRTCVAEGGFDSQRNLVFPNGARLIQTYYRAAVDGETGLNRVLLTQVDLTENRRIEAALRQALRLEVVGQLTGGVAHDFNNLLTAIIGSLELLGRAVEDERQRRWIRVANEAAQRGATLTQQLLSYARKQFLAPTATDIPAALQGMKELISGSLGSRIVLQMDFDADTWLAHTDIAQLELALLNLTVNARTAMPQGGRLLLSTRNVPPGATGLPQELEPNAYIVLAVADTGLGMEPDVLARAMEPFFTTKGIGQGSGLGLSQAYGFARQLGGTVRLTSRPGAGTTAEIFLPRAVA